MASINYTVLTGRNLASGTVTITRSGATATVTETAHGRISTESVTIAGANETEYNGDFAITVSDANTYTYTVSGSPATPATGTITATRTNANAYDFDFTIADLIRDEEMHRHRHRAIGGRTETIHWRGDRYMMVVPNMIEAANLARWVEIVHCVRGGEEFTLDPDGTAASPVNPVSVIMDSDSVSFRIATRGTLRYSTQFRVLLV